MDQGDTVTAFSSLLPVQIEDLLLKGLSRFTVTAFSAIRVQQACHVQELRRGHGISERHKVGENN